MTPLGPIEDATIESRILDLLAQRDVHFSCCPSDIARSLAPGDESRWRSLMPRVREAASRLVRSGRVVVTRGAQTLPPGELDGGPIRIRRGKKF